jgi:hypothetical protein
MKVGDLVRIKGLARPENADVGIVIAFKARGWGPYVEATVLWSGKGRSARYWSSDLEKVA